MRPLFKDIQSHKPLSTRATPAQIAAIDAAATTLGVSRSRLLRHAALTVASELAAGAPRPAQMAR